jgi:hypothetical protein
MKKLNETEKRDHFKVPENYFRDVNRKIISSTSGYLTPSSTGKNLLYHRIKPYFSKVAVVVVFLLLGYTALKILTPVRAPMDISEITLQLFSDSYFDDIDLTTLEGIVGQPLLTVVLNDISKSEIIDYLLLENIDISEIYEQL